MLARICNTCISGMIVALLAGCSVVGPKAVLSGRMAYIEAINETNNQQLLMAFVHNRYEESNTLLAVSSVTANVSVSSRATIQAGFGDSDNYDGNLVPFSGGFLYEENPTISYTPVAGEAYLNQLTSPLPLSILAQFTQSLPHPETAYNMLIASVNGIRNPAFLHGNQQADPRFDRFTSLMTQLGHEHCLHWAASPGQTEAIELRVERLGSCKQQANELLDLLQIDRHVRQGDPISIPVKQAPPGGDVTGIMLTTRTVWNLVEIVSAAVEVPPEDENSGVAPDFPRPGKAGQDLRIRYANARPESAYVAVEHRDGWFYIDERDIATKRYFKLLGSLWSAAMAKSLNSAQARPVLTVPVSR